MGSERTDRAFIVTGTDYSHVRFAKHNVVARREGALELNEEFEDVSCYRAPEFDDYAEAGGVPIEVLWAHCWWWNCANCHEVTDIESEGVVINSDVLCKTCKPPSPAIDAEGRGEADGG